MFVIIFLKKDAQRSQAAAIHTATNKELRATITALSQSVNNMAQQVAATHALQQKQQKLLQQQQPQQQQQHQQQQNTSSKATNSSKATTSTVVEEPSAEARIAALAGSDGRFTDNEEKALTILLGLQVPNGVCLRVFVCFVIVVVVFTHHCFFDRKFWNKFVPE
jgi:HAMP domain-containing protein